MAEPIRANPGSDEARAAGCLCAVLDNNHGLSAPFGEYGWYVREDCPLHGGHNLTLTDLGVSMARHYFAVGSERLGSKGTCSGTWDEVAPKVEAMLEHGQVLIWPTPHPRPSGLDSRPEPTGDGPE